MNYLAHIYLSGNNIELMIGNFIADAVKGRALERYSIDIQKGIKLHHSIDHFTDTHDIVKKSKKRLWGKYRHYNAVIVDIFYDHFLAKNWKNHHPLKLEEFTNNSYNTFTDNLHVFPDKMQLFYNHMVKNNWLYNYQFVEGIKMVMGGMAKRTTFKSGMENSTEDLLKYYDEFEYEFESFFPLLKQYTDSEIAVLL